jgi:non-heme chloroperoxidase
MLRAMRSDAGIVSQATAWPEQESSLPAADAGRIHCISLGSGPTLLLAHGYLLDVSLWRPLSARLASAGYRVVSFDQRGHAASRDGRDGCSVDAAIADYATVLQHFGADGATLVGHSMGGFLGLQFCLRYPELTRRMRRLVLLGANAGSVAEGSLSNRLQIPLLRMGLIPKLWRIPSVGRALVKPLFGRDPDPGWLESTRQMLIGQTVTRSLPLLHAMCYENHYARLGELSVPTRVLCGELDRTCPAWHSRRLAEELPNAKGTWLPGIGHMLPFEAADAVYEAIVGD